MKINNISFSKAGNKINEDIAYSTDNYGWVIDGATGLTNSKLTNGNSDAQFFVSKWDEYLRKNIEDFSRDLKEIIKDGIAKIKGDFENECGINFDVIDSVSVPSASIIVLRKKEDKMEYISIGDATMIVTDIDGQVSVVYDNSLNKLDKKALTSLKYNMDTYGYDFKEARESINDMLMEHRLMKNKENGYWVLSFNDEAIEYSLHGELRLKDFCNIAIFSDGYIAIADLYNYINYRELLLGMKNGEVEGIYKKLREIEEDDSLCEKYIRFKKSDNASCVMFWLENNA